MDSFDIELDKSSYAPGQTVSGKVTICTFEKVPATYLKVCAHGRAHTKWTENEHKHKTNLQGERESYHETVEYSSRREYFDTEIIAWKANGEEHLPVGRHIFSFSFPLPIYCPPSFEGFDGHIRYTVHVELDRPWKLSKKIEKRFTVESYIDPLSIPGEQTPMEDTKVKNTGFLFKNGVVSMKVRLPKRAYATKEVIPISVWIENNSRKAVVNVRAEMNQNSVYSAAHCGHEHHKKDWKEIAQSRKSISIKPKTEGMVELTLKVPRTVPSFQSEIIGVVHCLKVSIDTMSTFGSTLTCDFPIIIGSIVPTSDNEEVTSSSVVPSAPPMLRMESQPPEYSTLTPTGPSAPLESPGLPPSYEESMFRDNTKL